MIDRGFYSPDQLRTANHGKLKTNSLVSKSKQTKPATAGATASQSKSVLKTLDFDRRFIDVLVSLAALEYRL